MSSYLPSPSPNGRGKRGEDEFKKRFIEGQAKLKRVIDNIEDTTDDSTMIALAEYEESGVPVKCVAEMLRSIRRDLLDADRELCKAAEVLSEK